MRILALLFVAAFVAPVSVAGPSDDDRLNVLWLTVEDMSPWISAYGDDTVPTPNLDAFAAQAMRFDNAYASSPVCAPARTALITGMYPTRIGAMHMRVRSRSKGVEHTPLYEAVPPPWVRCFPETLRLNGYFTTNHTKTDYQFKAPACVWSENGKKASYLNRPEGMPFFSVINYTGTHESRAFPDVKRQPSVVDPDDVPIPPFYPDTPAVRDAMARTYDNIAAMDEWFGREIAKLEEAGLADSTVVFFFSDHGVGLPRGKRSLYSTGTQVPLLIRYPEGREPKVWAQGDHWDLLVSFIDFGPTVLSIAGIKPDRRLDGRAFLGEYPGEVREAVFFHADRFDGVYDRARGATDGRRLVIRNDMTETPHIIANAYRERLPMTQDLYDLRDGGARAESRTDAQWQTGSSLRPKYEYYDRAEDPWEVVNLAEKIELDESKWWDFFVLRSSLNGWASLPDDLGMVLPERDMIAAHLWPDGVQPVTEVPEIRRAPAGEFALVEKTEGSSLFYRQKGEGSWIPARPKYWVDFQGVVEVRAHRIGFKPSAVVEVTR